MRNDQLEVLYSRYYKELYVYSFSLCKDNYLAQDLVNETFFKALLSIDNIQNYIKFWLFRVCKNLYLDYLKKNKRLQDIELHIGELFQEDNTLDKIIKSEERKKVYCEVLKLQQSYKEIIILYYYCSLSLKEIGVIVGISEGAARSLLFRARKKLKEGLEEEY
ncbi:MAG: RNA polymerase sigma factor [Clostridiaceae bacterium]